ncbi:acyltransferase [Salinicoccus sp. HZC-1]|uniref:acyltransferase n=1 Tax=Salinicoccus sp. HZC-1 TaxID=3385497 RepID=UPI00398B7514
MNKLIYKVKNRLGKINPKIRADYYREKKILNCGLGCEIHQTVVLGAEPYLITIGDNVKITADVKFFTHDGGMWVLRNLGINPYADKMGTIEIGDNVFIGQNVILLPNIVIGSNVVIGAGSIVTKNIPNNSIAVGAPAAPIMNINDYYKKNIKNIHNTKEMNAIEKKAYYCNLFQIMKC